MRLDAESRAVLGSARIGMLALAAGRFPLVNPAAFSYADGSVWMTTSRFAAKVGMTRRNPRAAFLVEGDGRTVLLQGVLEVYDLRSIAGGVRALLEGPSIALGMAGYAAKNAAFIGGYLVDAPGIPAEWWPHNRVVMRLRPSRARVMSADFAVPRRKQPVPVAPRVVSKAVQGASVGYLCWVPAAGFPNLATVMWGRDGDDMLAWLPSALGSPPVGTPGALVAEYHHPFRARRMAGVCLRGPLEADPSAAASIGDRYGVDFHAGTPLRLRTRRVTWWQGFQVTTRAVVQGRGQAPVSS